MNGGSVAVTFKEGESTFVLQYDGVVSFEIPFETVTVDDGTVSFHTDETTVTVEDLRAYPSAYETCCDLAGATNDIPTVDSLSTESPARQSLMTAEVDELLIDE